MIACPSPKCGSPNVADLPHYWQSLPTESPLKSQYAPPASASGGYGVAAVAVLVGIAMVVSGSLFGLLVAAGGLAWGAVVQRTVAAADARRAAWESSRVCLACTGMF